jgi:hypothetical protein
MSKKNDFKKDDKIKALLWCARHCCLCEKPTNVGIEIAHIVQDSGDNTLENAMPLCFDCHAVIGHYNKEHPRGKMYSAEELKALRDQIYDKYTAHLLSKVQCSLFQRDVFELPKVGCAISHLGETYPLKAKVDIDIYYGGKKYKPITAGHHNGRYLWNLNPGFTISGHFEIPFQADPKKENPLMAKVSICLVDIYEREHNLLPVGFIHDGDDWYVEPCMEVFPTDARQ